MNEWPPSSSVAYITGGTSRDPRLVYYSPEKWQRVVRNKHGLFAHYRIGDGDRGAICTPFDPWSMGRIHLEAALLTGARALPLGLTLDQDAMLHILADFQPTFICGGARYLARAGKRLRDLVPSMKSPKYLFVAGEKLLPKLREECGQAWGAKVVDVYGMAEFDMVGYELENETGELCLIDDHRYALRLASGITVDQLVEGMTGELAVRGNPEADWHYTGDIVTVAHGGTQGNHLATSERQIRVLFDHRLETTIVLGDGTMVLESHVVKVLESAQISYGQLRVCRTGRGDRLILAVPHSAALADAEIVAALLNANVDLADSVRCNVAKLTISREDAVDLFMTNRGKAPLLVEISDEPVR